MGGRALRVILSAFVATLAISLGAACGGGSGSEASPVETSEEPASSTETSAVSAEAPTASEETAVSTEAPTEPLKVGWLIFGPKNDGGFGQLHYEALESVEETFGDRVENLWADNVPFSEEATQIAEGFVSQGAKLLIDTGAVGDLFLDVCKEHPDVNCIEQYYVGELPDNVTSYYTEFWNQQYLLGMAAGKLTKTGIIGFAGPFQIPLVKAAINSWVLGCQSVRPDCQARVIWINTWYDPPKSNQATNSLIDAGADVVNSFVSDPGYCQVAETRGVWAIGLYTDWSQYCPNAYVNTMVWDFRKLFQDEVQLELDGEWTGGRNVILGPSEGAGIGTWGKNVPEDVQTAVEAAQDEISGGENPFVGPIYDQEGKLRVEEGQELSEDFLYSGWDWLVKGVNG